VVTTRPLVWERMAVHISTSRRWRGLSLVWLWYCVKLKTAAPSDWLNTTSELAAPKTNMRRVICRRLVMVTSVDFTPFAARVDHSSINFEDKMGGRSTVICIMDSLSLLSGLRAITTETGLRMDFLQRMANLIRNSGNYRWVGLYDVDHAAQTVAIVVYSGRGAPEFPTFPITKGLTGGEIRNKRQ
jgi:hypothetical protein